MNEIKVGIRYSRLSDIFVCYFYVRINSNNESAIELALQYVQNTNFVAEFIEWAKHYFDQPQETSTQRPLVDVLPVVSMEKLNRKKGD